MMEACGVDRPQQLPVCHPTLRYGTDFIFRSTHQHGKIPWRDWCLFEESPNGTQVLGHIFGIFTTETNQIQLLVREYVMLDTSDVEEGWLPAECLAWHVMTIADWTVIDATAVIDTAFVLHIVTKDVERRPEEKSNPSRVFFLDKALYADMHPVPKRA